MNDEKKRQPTGRHKAAEVNRNFCRRIENERRGDKCWERVNDF